MNTVAAHTVVDQAVAEISADAFASVGAVHDSEIDNVRVPACSSRASAQVVRTTIEMRSQAG
jgi:hypothetical protein